jgi:hypothetical protein
MKRFIFLGVLFGLGAVLVWEGSKPLKQVAEL